MDTSLNLHRANRQIISCGVASQKLVVKHAKNDMGWTQPLFGNQFVPPTTPAPQKSKSKRFQILWQLISYLARLVMSLLRKLPFFRRAPSWFDQKEFKQQQIRDLQDQCIEKEQIEKRNRAKGEMWTMFVQTAETVEELQWANIAPEEKNKDLWDYAFLNREEFESIKRTLSVDYDLVIYNYRAVGSEKVLKKELNQPVVGSESREIYSQNAFSSDVVHRVMTLIDSNLEKPRRHLSNH